MVKALLTLAAVGVAALPAALVFGLGVHRSGVLPDPLGPDSGALFFLTLFYVLWLPVTVFGLIWLFDRLGYHYAAGRRTSRERRAARRVRRRRAAGLSYLEGQERARRSAELDTRERTRRSAEPGTPEQPRSGAGSGAGRRPAGSAVPTTGTLADPDRRRKES